MMNGSHAVWHIIPGSQCISWKCFCWNQTRRNVFPEQYQGQVEKWDRRIKEGGAMHAKEIKL